MQSSGEQKTKPTQHSVRELRALGVPPDIVSVCCFGFTGLWQTQTISVLDRLPQYETNCQECQRKDQQLLPGGTDRGKSFRVRFFRRRLFNGSLLQVISVHDTSNVYHVPLVLTEQNVIQFLIKRLQLSVAPVEYGVIPKALLKWQEIARRYENIHLLRVTWA